jgi:hypothetical protein
MRQGVLPNRRDHQVARIGEALQRRAQIMASLLAIVLAVSTLACNDSRCGNPGGGQPAGEGPRPNT